MYSAVVGDKWTSKHPGLVRLRLTHKHRVVPFESITAYEYVIMDFSKVPLGSEPDPSTAEWFYKNPGKYARPHPK